MKVDTYTYIHINQCIHTHKLVHTSRYNTIHIICIDENGYIHIHTHKSVHMCMYCMYFFHIVCILWHILCISLLYCMYCLYFLQPKVLVGRYAQHTYNIYTYIQNTYKYIFNTYKNTCKYMHIHAF